jgi:hypothetical protein
MAHGLHRIVEKPLIRLGKRTGDRISPAPAVAIGGPTLARG